MRPAYISVCWNTRSVFRSHRFQRQYPILTIPRHQYHHARVFQRSAPYELLQNTGSVLVSIWSTQRQISFQHQIHPANMCQYCRKECSICHHKTNELLKTVCEKYLARHRAWAEQRRPSSSRQPFPCPLREGRGGNLTVRVMHCEDCDQKLVGVSLLLLESD